MIDLKIDVVDILKWAADARKAPGEYNQDVADALNAVGQAIRREMVADAATQMGITLEEANRMVAFHEANAGSLIWEMDTSKLEEQQRTWVPSREWLEGKTPRYSSGGLVELVTVGDDRVCPICEQLSEEGPYTVDELEARIGLIKALPTYRLDLEAQANIAAREVRTHLIHHNCSCVIISSRVGRRRLPVSFASPGGWEKPRRITAGGIAERLLREMFIEAQKRRIFR